MSCELARRPGLRCARQPSPWARPARLSGLRCARPAGHHCVRLPDPRCARRPYPLARRAAPSDPSDPAAGPAFLAAPSEPAACLWALLLEPRPSAWHSRRDHSSAAPAFLAVPRVAELVRRGRLPLLDLAFALLALQQEPYLPAGGMLPLSELSV